LARYDFFELLSIEYLLDKVRCNEKSYVNRRK